MFVWKRITVLIHSDVEDFDGKGKCAVELSCESDEERQADWWV